MRKGQLASDQAACNFGRATDVAGAEVQISST
jgi:hypothetical protein